MKNKCKYSKENLCLVNLEKNERKIYMCNNYEIKTSRAHILYPYLLVSVT